MLISISYILLVGMFLGYICKKIKIPSLFGMVITGILLGPYVLNLIDASILSVSSELRRIALLIILLRAGLSLDIGDLKKVGRPAILMCFVPACFEIVGMIVLAPKLLNITVLDAAIMGAVIAAVSPAVIVPKMLKLMEEGYGTNKNIPQLILAGAAVDDVFVIVIFTTFTGMAKGSGASIWNFVNIPVSILLGILIGLFIGYLYTKFFTKYHIRDTIKVIILLSTSFIMVTIEDTFSAFLPFSALIGVMCIGIAFQKYKENVAKRLSLKFNKLWVIAEILLFVLVGATVDLNNAFTAGFRAVFLLFGVLLFRMIGVYVSLIGTKLNNNEKLFCMIGYTPKATVQAAIGGIPLAMGLACGNIVLTISVLAILITAPLGAFFIDKTYKTLLTKK